MSTKKFDGFDDRVAGIIREHAETKNSILRALLRASGHSANEVYNLSPDQLRRLVDEEGDLIDRDELIDLIALLHEDDPARVAADRADRTGTELFDEFRDESAKVALWQVTGNSTSGEDDEYQGDRLSYENVVRHRLAEVEARDRELKEDLLEDHDVPDAREIVYPDLTNEELDERARDIFAGVPQDELQQPPIQQPPIQPDGQETPDDRMRRRDDWELPDFSEWLLPGAGDDSEDGLPGSGAGSGGSSGGSSGSASGDSSGSDRPHPDVDTSPPGTGLGGSGSEGTAGTDSGSNDSSTGGGPPAGSERYALTAIRDQEGNSVGAENAWLGEDGVWYDQNGDPLPAESQAKYNEAHANGETRYISTEGGDASGTDEDTSGTDEDTSGTDGDTSETGGEAEADVGYTPDGDDTFENHQRAEEEDLDQDIPSRNDLVIDPADPTFSVDLGEVARGPHPTDSLGDPPDFDDGQRPEGEPDIPLADEVDDGNIDPLPGDDQIAGTGPYEQPADALSPGGVTLDNPAPGAGSSDSEGGGDASPEATTPVVETQLDIIEVVQQVPTPDTAPPVAAREQSIVTDAALRETQPAVRDADDSPPPTADDYTIISEEIPTRSAPAAFDATVRAPSDDAVAAEHEIERPVVENEPDPGYGASRNAGDVGSFIAFDDPTRDVGSLTAFDDPTSDVDSAGGFDEHSFDERAVDDDPLAPSTEVVFPEVEPPMTSVTRGEIDGLDSFGDPIGAIGGSEPLDRADGADDLFDFD